ncbi:two-component system response regulator RegA [Rhizobium sp. BK312]|uniref:response regulator transcription factor n=1 Tax=Rhizobium sp. BK312 TaxID=2587080 RepID=UPI001615DCA2|nr:response regulator [Rhizobium sp. BK312]MBB3429157.1 two-component system response regulator RegA [Rhizobium sp. BK312]
MENPAIGTFIGRPTREGAEPSILVVDDDVRLFSRLQSAFLEYGFATEHCGSITDAVDTFNARCFDALVTELVVGGESGVTFIKAVASAAKETPLVVLTAYGSIGAAVTSIKLGARNFLIKPAETEDILEGLELLGRAKFDAERALRTPQLVRWDHVLTIWFCCKIWGSRVDRLPRLLRTRQPGSQPD